MSKLPQFLLKESKRRVSDDSYFEDSQIDPKPAKEPSQINKQTHKGMKEIPETDELFVFTETSKPREFTSIDDNMTPYLCDILAELDKEVCDTEQVFKEYVNGIIEETEVLLTNSSGFESTLVKAVAQYEDKASELILETIEKYNLPIKLMKLNQLKLRNKIYLEEISNKQSASKHNDIKNNNGYIQNYLYETCMDKAKSESIFNGESKLESIPFLTESTLKSIEETNKHLSQILEQELKIQTEIFKN